MRYLLFFIEHNRDIIAKTGAAIHLNRIYRDNYYLRNITEILMLKYIGIENIGTIIYDYYL